MDDVKEVMESLSSRHEILFPINNVMEARVEIPQRCWIKVQLQMDEYKNIQKVNWNAQGSFELIRESEKFFESMNQKNLNQLEVVFPPTGPKTHHLLFQRLLDKLKGEFKETDQGLEICHCRKISQGEIEKAILLGAHTADKVKKWTTASSGCGTCRPEVEGIIAVCLSQKKKAL